MSEKFSSGTYNPKQTNKHLTSEILYTILKPFLQHLLHRQVFCELTLCILLDRTLYQYQIINDKQFSFVNALDA